MKLTAFQPHAYLILKLQKVDESVQLLKFKRHPLISSNPNLQLSNICYFRFIIFCFPLMLHLPTKRQIEMKPLAENLPLFG